MNDICEKAVKTIKTLRDDHDHILGVDDYDWFQAYIEGYVDSLNISSNTDLRIDITNVYNPGENHIYWTDQIKYKNQYKENSEKVSILLDITEKYFSDHSSWFIETDLNKLKSDIFFRLNGLKERRGMFFSERLPLNIYLEGFVDGLCVYINNSNFAL